MLELLACNRLRTLQSSHECPKKSGRETREDQNNNKKNVGEKSKRDYSWLRFGVFVEAQSSQFQSFFFLLSSNTHCLLSPYPNWMPNTHASRAASFFSVVSFHNFYSLRFQFHFICWTCKKQSSGKARRSRGVFFLVRFSHQTQWRLHKIFI